MSDSFSDKNLILGCFIGMSPTQYAARSIHVGVNQGWGTSRLQRASDDAQALAHHALSGRGGSFHAREVTLLQNDRATRAAVINAINRLPYGLDLLLFTASCHGSPEGLVLADNVLFHEELVTLLNKTGAGKKLIIIDACAAGALADYVPGLGDPEPRSRYMYRVLSAARGARVLMACAASQNARENTYWPLGDFTGALLHSANVLEGDTGNIITADRVFDRARLLLKEIGSVQDPVKLGRLEDFPFAVSDMAEPLGEAFVRVTPRFPTPLGLAGVPVRIDVTIRGRRFIPTYLGVIHESNGTTRCPIVKPIDVPYTATAWSQDMILPLVDVPATLNWFHSFQPVRTRVVLVDREARIIGQQAFDWVVRRN